MDNILHLPELDGVNLTAVAWDNSCPELSTKVKLLLIV